LLGACAAAVVLTAVGFLVAERERPRPGWVGPAIGSGAPPSALEGKWAGDGRLARCAGLEDEDCSGTREVVLAIDCASGRCTVTPFGRGYGSPPLRVEDGAYVAAGPVPPDAAPTCGGVPTASALWRLELTVDDGRLRGTYAESTVQGFDCGGTGVTWEFALERR